VSRSEARGTATGLPIGSRRGGWILATILLLAAGCGSAPHVELPPPESGEFLTLEQQRALSSGQLEEYCGMLNAYLDELRSDVTLARALQDSLDAVLDSLTVESGRASREVRQLERELQQTKLARDSATTYVTKAGDTLTSLATLFYGSTANWRKIYNANLERVEDPQAPLKPGLRLTIPQ
jgi:nucleoid-associated protein YgaU